MKNIVVLVSGNGTNLQAIIDACESTIENAKVRAVFSNKESAFALERARKAGAEAEFLDPKLSETREAFDAELMRRIDVHKPDLLVLAGYMRILSGEFVRHYMGRMINIHPSLLPKYPGLHTHQRAIDNCDEHHGTSIHFVTEKLDGGPIILQAKVPVFDDDTIETLEQRVQSQEHKIYPLVVKWFVEGRLSMDGSKAMLDGLELGPQGYADK
ncbi:MULTISPECIES: phosphoribosylglycinamide formyltransferase [Vibrio]|jgi:phosphoribosylglycinamide formyltransferase-1|uniref:Phosphoribosylglycinamide formyltransferase n=2 Tax=Vibrio TaxID=662 RepID=A0A2C9P7V8_9VIBR|nr:MULTISPECIES: phosphoribosylglycinamide formyltransferase [Vibrio]ASI88821.1 phosphoribosylglycinamide formyltransferase [Vibrio mediterranei]AYV20776.1 phosphoribosylglycinamide formyltransferase [Vibrio mediterranei]EDL52822.1 phosphoribosylglycinamide formyltransferase [Vibrio mediterranei AK1]KFA97244.1 phosphoribosylglycinamide formyltransferase [Vibrio sp. ER1A]MCF4175400.1 phosphoribosylglycinamide formyltransferase [Vibrio sp. McD22-P3]